MRTLTYTVLFAGLLALLAPSVTLAYGSNKNGYNNAQPELSNRLTQRLVRTLQRGVKRCQRQDSIYRYDCYRQAYQVATDQVDGLSLIHI